MTIKGSGKLCIVSTKVNLEVHQVIPKHFIIFSSEDLCEDDFVFQQNSATSHTSKLTTKWFKKKERNVFPTMFTLSAANEDKIVSSFLSSTLFPTLLCLQIQNLNYGSVF